MKLKYLSIPLISVALLTSCNNEKSKEEEQPTQELTSENKELDEINEQIINNPGSSNGFYRRAEYFAKLGELSNAIDDINRALQIDPQVDFLNLFKARVLLSQNRITDALIYAEKAVEYNKDYFEGHLLIAKLQYINGDYKVAMKELDEALKLDKFKAEPYFVKGILFETLNDSLKAATSYQTAIEQDPEYFDAYYKLAALYNARKPELSIQYLERAHEIAPNNLHTLRILSNQYIEQNNFEKAMYYLNKMKAIDPGYSETYFFMGKAYVDIYDDKSPKNTRDTTMYKAIEYFTKATELYTDFTEAYFMRGSCYQELNETGKAIQDYQKALDINPQYELATEALRSIDR